MTVNDNGGNTPNYFPNSYSELPQPDPSRPDIHPYKSVPLLENCVMLKEPFFIRVLFAVSVSCTTFLNSLFRFQCKLE
jgi:hypothetical protein